MQVVLNCLLCYNTTALPIPKPSGIVSRTAPCTPVLWLPSTWGAGKWQPHIPRTQGVERSSRQWHRWLDFPRRSTEMLGRELSLRCGSAFKISVLFGNDFKLNRKWKNIHSTRTPIHLWDRPTCVNMEPCLLYHLFYLCLLTRLLGFFLKRSRENYIHLYP